ncbi:MAG: tRNA (adenosine(37)-N6)-threonylcarbamoyltransferase complex ATPase subunit type 1 TsaE [Gracilibacteraceae bacterium]|jgi:tRNA threonylcarbamoyladenosine biosynthesis protein TsaE|nr:tRNA (adenosine(37)-N6)-threonylcarbamoyltransferase complex ATPase subunit type 1 TsaE [Gracilibacteraceae bacterium]
MSELTFRWPEASDTERGGAALGACLRGGDAVLVSGDLGAGKTVFVRGAGGALGVTAPITSPTFTLIEEYAARGRARLVHMDLYRLERAEEAEVIGVFDFFRPDAIVFVEWPELIEAAMPPEALRVEIKGSGATERRARFIFAEEFWGERLLPLTVQ